MDGRMDNKLQIQGTMSHDHSTLHHNICVIFF
jgi:hypothetical protein